MAWCAPDFVAESGGEHTGAVDALMFGFIVVAEGPLAFRYQRGLPVLVRAVTRRAYGSWTTPSSIEDADLANFSSSFGVASPLGALGRHPDCVFRSSIPRPPMPPSTQHPDTSRRPAQDSRSRWTSLLLSCGDLSSPAARRFIPALALADARGSETGRQSSNRRRKQSQRGHCPASLEELAQDELGRGGVPSA